MPQPRIFRTNLVALIDAINELRYLQSVVYSASDILSGDTGRFYTIEKRINYSGYLLSLYETELNTVMEEIEDIYNEFQKLS